MNARQASQIHAHGTKLLKLYPSAAEQDPIMLCSKLHRLEMRAHRTMIGYCNGLVEYDEAMIAAEKVLLSVIRLLRPNENSPEIRVNTDPRGYALKIPEDAARGLDVYHDMGGNGIICPEFDGR